LSLRLAVDHVEDFDGSVGGAGGEALSVKVELGIVNHIIMLGLNGNRVLPCRRRHYWA
jgi:hypothetical protein